jgi:hypothetical protein
MIKGSHGSVTAVAHDWGSPDKTPSAPSPLPINARVQGPLGQWARLVAAAVVSTEPLTSFSDWAAIVRLSARTLRNRCHAAGLRGKPSLDFTRVLRVVVTEQEGVRLSDQLEVYDARTIARLARASGIGEREPIPSVRTFLHHQQFICDPQAVHLVAALLQLQTAC